jgi:hypothetical protein
MHFSLLQHYPPLTDDIHSLLHKKKCIILCPFSATIWLPVHPLSLTRTPLIPCYHFQWACPVQAPIVPRSKTHIHFPVLSSCQSIRPGPRLYCTFRNTYIFAMRSCYSSAQTPTWRATPCRLSATANLIYSQLLAICGGRLRHPQLEDVPCCGDNSPIMTTIITR